MSVISNESGNTNSTVDEEVILSTNPQHIMAIEGPMLSSLDPDVIRSWLTLRAEYERKVDDRNDQHPDAYQLKTLGVKASCTSRVLIILSKFALSVSVHDMTDEMILEWLKRKIARGNDEVPDLTEALKTKVIMNPKIKDAEWRCLDLFMQLEELLAEYGVTNCPDEIKYKIMSKKIQPYQVKQKINRAMEFYTKEKREGYQNNYRDYCDLIKKEVDMHQKNQGFSSCIDRPLSDKKNNNNIRDDKNKKNNYNNNIINSKLGYFWCLIFGGVY